MSTRVPASERTSQRLRELLGDLPDGEALSEVMKLGMRKIVEEALEAEVSDALGRGYNERGGELGRADRNGTRTGRLKTAEGVVEYGAPQVADRTEPFRSRIREQLGQRTQALEELAVEMYARGLLHLAPGTKEDTESCRAFFQDLKRRGLPDPLLVATDGAPGLIRAVEECFPRSHRQRCLAHRSRNLQSKVTEAEAEWPVFRVHVKACYEAPSLEMARALRQGLVDRYAKTFPAAVACFEDDFEACIARLRFPIAHRKVIRTTNLLERLFVEERRRTKIIPSFFHGERPVLKLDVRRVDPRHRALARHPHEMG